jgi:hypothetical protein
MKYNTAGSLALFALKSGQQNFVLILQIIEQTGTSNRKSQEIPKINLQT